MNRRLFLTRTGQLSAALGFGLPALAGAQTRYGSSPGQAPSPTNVVLLELINFHCSRCRTVNDHVDRIRVAAGEAGIDFRVAPVAWERQSLWPVRVYYATRDVFPEVEGLVRNAIFEGIQREGMAFENLEQTLAYLERRAIPQRGQALYRNFSLVPIAERAVTEAVLLSDAKAGRLLDMSGAQEVPVFLWIKGGDIVHMVSPQDANDPGSLVRVVVQTLSQIKKS
ncbi:hypothetical protein ACOTHJ_15185 [Achromobacter xylosoxidans]